MADVDMPDVGPSTSAPTKAPIKSSKSGAAEGGADGRKRFEVKKVPTQLSQFLETLSSTIVLFAGTTSWISVDYPCIPFACHVLTCINRHRVSGEPGFGDE